MKHDGMNIGVEATVQQFPIGSAIDGLKHVTHLQSDVHRFRIFRVAGDIAHMGFDNCDRVVDRPDPGDIPYRVEPLPTFGGVPADKDIDRFGARVEGIGIAGINGEAANFARAALAVARFFPGGTEIFAQPDAIATGAGKHLIGRRWSDRNFRDFPIFERVIL